MASRLHFVPSKKNRQDRRTNEIPIPTSPSYALYYTVSRRILYTCTSTIYGLFGSKRQSASAPQLWKKYGKIKNRFVAVRSRNDRCRKRDGTRQVSALCTTTAVAVPRAKVKRRVILLKLCRRRRTVTRRLHDAQLNISIKIQFFGRRLGRRFF